MEQARLKSDRGSVTFTGDPAALTSAFQNIGKGRVCPSVRSKTSGEMLNSFDGYGPIIVGQTSPSLSWR